ncbi:MAG: hypothetical protein A3B96_02515 [Candidatus Spechtbacteria bacterium RIFCSPHIGHO2_02_FULL_43_15b]|uniref:Nucleoid-associated protein, YbaB/EbfC family n=1 Tax=Candidatus Spechtbacteria bacterium RIFCSPHIGHO2_01_FULL_43_30 TaxID=1802158 RepID=A0A1G2H6K6_9BACT|nr:MAG: hypothetical protein A2827_02670 [Candidatus Spechtbacteria bacterium RIFCSPHIGHO2_01_FULL_43_30]OGZ60174.1 MAG: hypothetical protein A3B96_02515 [Candidatus Spechtbacteria bacterium RIFCSPHIGHO2_02_FULL_43_15b]
MLDKLKQLKEARDIQKNLQNEKFSEERDGVGVVINGVFSVEKVFLNAELSKEGQENLIRECFNAAIKRAQTNMAAKFSGMVRG